jgi:sugar/nucleoside kinase (ribokinase family)
MRLGVVGTFVRDTIWTLGDRAAGRPFEGWGGVAYALAAAAAARPAGWEIVPLAKVGRDLADSARTFVDRLPGVDAAGMRVVPEPNNRVELRYSDDARRGERLTGGVPAWTWDELAGVLEGVDALYVNFLSGFELELDTAEALRAGFAGPIYADLHSLLLGCPGAGVRAMRRLPEWERWVRCFDAVQLNEEELGMLLGGEPGGEPHEGAARIVAEGPGLVVVTRGAGGASYALRAGFPADPLRWRVGSPGTATESATESATIAVPAPVDGGDPTGAGDVWGATLVCALLAGDAIGAAVARAHAAAARKMTHRGADGLFAHLSG